LVYFAVVDVRKGQVIPQEHRALDALEGVRMRIASNGKRFHNHMSYEREQDHEGFKLTKNQALYLWYLVDMYRRQIKDEELKRWAAHRRLTGELPPIYLEGDHRKLQSKKKQLTRRQLVETQLWGTIK
jgi:hypothetical protein